MLLQTGLPIALVIAHMFGSALLLIGATWQVLVATETDWQCGRYDIPQTKNSPGVRARLRRHPI